MDKFLEGRGIAAGIIEQLKDEKVSYTILVFIITVKFFNGTCKSLPRAGEQKCGENL